MNKPSTDIRLIQVDDAEVLADHLARDAEAFVPWDPEHPAEFYTTAGQRSRIESFLMMHDKGELWPGVILAEGFLIGQVTVKNIVRRSWRKAELGYWVTCSYQGQGHATRAVGLAVQVMTSELELHRAEAFTQMDNARSHHVLRKNGFLPFGVARSSVFIAGMWRDEILWERLLDQ